MPKYDPNRLRLYDEQNLAAARIIVADPVRYAGAPLIWAQMVLERLKA